MLQTFLYDLLSNKLKFLNLTSEQMISDFSAHIGWSIAIPLLAQSLFGFWGMAVVVGLWTFECFWWKLVDRGHLRLLLSGEESVHSNSFHNLIVNMCSRLVFPICWLVYNIL